MKRSLTLVCMLVSGLGVSAFAQQIVFGCILVAAVAITMDRSKIAVIK